MKNGFAMHVLITYLIRASMRGDGEEVGAGGVYAAEDEGGADLALVSVECIQI